MIRGAHEGSCARAHGGDRPVIVEFELLEPEARNGAWQCVVEVRRSAGQRMASEMLAEAEAGVQAARGAGGPQGGARGHGR